VVLIDTAGRRGSKAQESVEYSDASRRAARRADVAIVLL
jgi:hypothetical protein